jgi:hypothetical protein
MDTETFTSSDKSTALAVDKNGRICAGGVQDENGYVRTFTQDGLFINEMIEEKSSWGDMYNGGYRTVTPDDLAVTDSSIYVAETTSDHSWSVYYPGNEPWWNYYDYWSGKVYQFDNNFNELGSLYYHYGYISNIDIVLGDDGTYYIIGDGMYEGINLRYGTELNDAAGSVNFGDYYYTKPTKMALQTDGTVLITGYFSGSIESKNSAGGYDCFLAKINPDKSIGWIVTWGGADYDIGLDVATDANGNAYVIGTFAGSADFDTSDAVYNVTSKGRTDAFVLRVDPKGVSKWVRTFGGSGGKVTPVGIVADSFGALYLYGTFSGSIDVNPTDAQDIRQSAGDDDIFLIKMLSGGNY